MHDTMPGSDAEGTPGDLRERARTALEAAWVDVGYTAPNTETYPWM
ncbi:MAG: hypothetical protein GWO04_41095, partial [Actinobacteria bacterium]|nr:hypothetical protein [Actinomycetota bacterium]NIS35945.1 hypothetical protein [Actinomycetota bacterium]NIV58619.1 hypothetical protein [Actinomycetota bacterium]NIW32448.1 hypothetical protein [Actinomycetota bacterium]